MSEGKDSNQKVDEGTEADDLEVTGQQADEVRGGATKGEHIPEVKL